MRKSVLVAAIASVAILAGGGAKATSIPTDDLTTSGSDAAPQGELLANAGALPDWTIVTPDLLAGNAGLGHAILQIHDVPTKGVNPDRPTPTPTKGPVQVPEPGTLVLLLSALGAMVLLRQRRRVGRTRA